MAFLLIFFVKPHKKHNNISILVDFVIVSDGVGEFHCVSFRLTKKGALMGASIDYSLSWGHHGAPNARKAEK